MPSNANDRPPGVYKADVYIQFINEIVEILRRECPELLTPGTRVVHEREDTVIDERPVQPLAD